MISYISYFWENRIDDKWIYYYISHEPVIFVSKLLKYLLFFSTYLSSKKIQKKKKQNKKNEKYINYKIKSKSNEIKLIKSLKYLHNRQGEVTLNKSYRFYLSVQSFEKWFLIVVF